VHKEAYEVASEQQDPEDEPTRAEAPQVRADGHADRWLGSTSNTAVVLGLRDCHHDRGNQHERQAPEDVV
jgi:hypothetical protein